MESSHAFHFDKDGRLVATPVHKLKDERKATQ